MKRLLTLAVLLGLFIGLATPQAWAMRAFYNVTNLCLQNNVFANAAWTKDATVTASDANAGCPLDGDGVRMSLITSGTVGNGVSQDNAASNSRGINYARPTAATSSCGLTVSDASGDGPVGVVAGASAARHATGTAGQTGIKIIGAGSTEGATANLDATQWFRPAQSIYDSSRSILWQLQQGWGVAEHAARLHAIDVSNSAVPALLGTTNTVSMDVASIYQSGNTVYMAGWNTCKAIDVTTPGAMTVGGTDCGFRGRGEITSGGGYIYGGGYGDFGVFDSSGVGVGSVATGFAAIYGMSYYAAGGHKYVYLGFDDNKLVIVNVDNPAAPTKTQVTVAGRFVWTKIVGSTLFLNGASGFYAYSLADPTAPALLSSTAVPDGSLMGTMKASADAQYLYMAIFTTPKVYPCMINIGTPAALPAILCATPQSHSRNDLWMATVAPVGSYAVTVSTLEATTWVPHVSATPAPFASACTTWCLSGAQLEVNPFARPYSGPTTSSPVTTKIWH